MMTELQSIDRNGAIGLLCYGSSLFLLGLGAGTHNSMLMFVVHPLTLLLGVWFLFRMVQSIEKLANEN